jgi:hypothetical protein
MAASFLLFKTFVPLRQFFMNRRKIPFDRVDPIGFGVGT